MARTIGMRQISIEIPAGPARIQLSTTDKFVTDFELYAVSTNSGDGFIGDVTVTADETAWVPLAAGEKKNYVHGTGTMTGGVPVGHFNFKNLYLIGAAGDEFVIQYFDYDNL